MLCSFCSGSVTPVTGEQCIRHNRNAAKLQQPGAPRRVSSVALFWVTEVRERPAAFMARKDATLGYRIVCLRPQRRTFPNGGRLVQQDV